MILEILMEEDDRRVLAILARGLDKREPEEVVEEVAEVEEEDVEEGKDVPPCREPGHKNGDSKLWNVYNFINFKHAKSRNDS